MSDDAEAFRALYRAHYRAVCRYLLARAGPDAVEDVAAETFLVAWRRRAEMPDHALPWLLNTAGKCLANQRRSRQRATALIDRIAAFTSAGTASIQDDLARDAQRRALLQALASLRERDRALLVLRHWDDLAPREVAAVLGLAPVLVRTRIHRAERRLRQALREALAEHDIPRPLTDLIELTESA
jgi:RNA polymerase sigma-70 factor (ECF subfamily)